LPPVAEPARERPACDGFASGVPCGRALALAPISEVDPIVQSMAEAQSP
jgi:hypothetical protein